MRKKTLPKLKKDLWKIFSEYIRRKDADEEGMTVCVSCGVKKHWKELQGGHFVPQSLGDALRFDEINVHVQCQACNVWNKERGMFGYARFMVKKYGEKVLEELHHRQKMGYKFSRSELEEMIEAYKEKLKNLEGEILGKH